MVVVVAGSVMLPARAGTDVVVTVIGTPGSIVPDGQKAAQPAFLASVLGAGKTKPAAATAPVLTTTAAPPPPVNPLAALLPSPPAAADAAPRLGLMPAEPTADKATSGTAGLAYLQAGDDAQASALQVQAGGPGSAGARSQENFFLFDALRREAQGKPGAGSGNAEPFVRNLPPALTYEAPQFSTQRLEAALNAPQVNTRQLIDQIMDGVFRPPVQLPKQVTLNLNPQHLGPLQVQVSMHDDGIRVQMMTPHAHVKAALEQNVAELRGALQNAGLALGSLGVDVRQDQNAQRFAQQFGQPKGSPRSPFGRPSGGTAIEGLASALPTPRAGPPRAAWAAGVNAFA